MSDTSDSHNKANELKDIKQEQAHDGEEPRTRKLFIGGVAFITTDEGFFKYFAKFGELEDCVLIREKETGQSRGFGFVTYKEGGVAEHVVEEQLFLDGRRLDPKPSISRRSMDQIHEHRNQATKIFVGGLPDDAVEAEMTEHFGRFGEVLEVNIMYDRFSNEPRGFGFVTFKDVETADAVIDYEGEHIIHGKSVDCKSATSRKDAFKQRDAQVERPKPISREERWKKYHGDQEHAYAAAHGYGGPDSRGDRYPTHHQHPHHPHSYPDRDDPYAAHRYAYAPPPPSHSYPHHPHSYSYPPPYAQPATAAAPPPPAYDYARYDPYYQHRAPQPPMEAAAESASKDDAKNAAQDEAETATKAAGTTPAEAPAASSYAYPPPPPAHHSYPPYPYHYGYPQYPAPSAPYDYYPASHATSSGAVAPPRVPPASHAPSSSHSNSGYGPSRGSSAVNSAQRSRYSAY